MKSISLLLFIALLAGTVSAQQRVRPDGMGGWIVEGAGICSGLPDFAQGVCVAEQQNMQQQQLQQQRLLQQQQIENQRLQNEILRRKLEQEQSATQSRQQAPQGDNSTNPEFMNWQSRNPWYGRDRARTEFALLYAKQLRQERPDLIGLPFFDAVATKVEEVFGTGK